MKLKHIYWLLVAVIIVLLFPQIESSAATKSKIKSVNIRLESDGFDSFNQPIIDVRTRSDHYSAGDVYTAADYYEDDSYEMDSNIFVIELQADDGYYFDTIKKDKIKISGLEAEFVKAARKNNGQNFYITAQVTGAGSFVDEISEARWSRGGYAEWGETYGAQSFIIALTNPKGRVRRVTTCGLQYDFRPYMMDSGYYSFKVRPVSSSGDKASWFEGGNLYVTDEMVASNKALFEVKKEVSYIGDEKIPSNEVVRYTNTGWQTTEEGKSWYRNTDGSYPQASWLKLDGDWYYFDTNGFMESNAYITYGKSDYYFGEDGKLVVSLEVPDGRVALEDGQLVDKRVALEKEKEQAVANTKALKESLKNKTN